MVNAPKDAASRGRSDAPSTPSFFQMATEGLSWVRRRILPVIDRIRIQRWNGRSPLKIVVGSGGIRQGGWLATGPDTLDLLEPKTWSRFFPEGSVDALLAEHVWEHLNAEDAVKAARTCFKYLKKNAYLRVAVPDGYHPSPDYIDSVRPGGSGYGADDHKVLYTYRSLSDVFRAAGFRVNLLEWFDENGQFHQNPWDEAEGLIRRSGRHDKRNTGGQLRYTSIILDAVKE